MLALSAWLWLVGSAPAAQLQLPRPKLCALADVVVVAEVTSSETHWTASPQGGIARTSWLAVSKTVRGPGGATLAVHLPGGTLGQIRQWVEDVPELLVDHRYLLFLRHSDQGLQVLGGAQGAVLLQRSPDDRGEPDAKALASLGGC